MAKSGEKIGAQAEIYDREALETVTPYVDKMRREDLDYCLNAYREDFEAGNQALVAYVSQVLGLKTMIGVRVKEVEPGENVVQDDGLYWNKKKEVTIFHVKGQKPSLHKTIDTIAHELWHAKQHEEIEEGGERAQVYREEFAHQIDPEKDYAGYRNQMIEQEAFVFGRSVAERAEATVRARTKQEQVVSKGIGSKLKSLFGIGKNVA